MTPTVFGQGQVTGLSFRPVAAEYSSALDHMILVSGSPNQLHIYSVQSQNDQTVALSAAPLSLALSPDGLHALVGHSSLLSYVNLSTAAVERTITIATTASYVALSSTWMYVFGESASGTSIAFSINIATGATSSLNTTFLGTATRFNAAVNTLYGTRDGTSPNDIEHYDISNGAIASQTDSIYHGDFNICGPIFFSAAGDRIYTGCGTVFHASTNPSLDMRYITTIPGAGSMQSLMESSALKRVALVPASSTLPGQTVNDGVVLMYNSDYLSPAGQFALADFSSGSRSFKAHGKWVFFNAASTLVYAVAEADSTAGLLNDFVIQTFPVSSSASCSAALAGPASATISGDGAMGTANVSGPTMCTYQATSDSSWLQILSGGYGAGNGTLTYIARANAGVSRSGRITLGNSTLTITQPSQSSSTLTHLPYNVTNAVYDRVLDKLLLTSGTPNELHIYDPPTMSEQTIALPVAPVSISLAPDGKSAAVGHDGWISMVDLQQNQVTNVLQLPIPVAALVTDGTAFVYAFGDVQGVAPQVFSLNTLNGALTTASSIFGSNAAHLSEDGSSIYASAEVGIEKWSIQNGQLNLAMNYYSVSPCSNFWITDDGTRMVTSCGLVYRTSTVPSQDLQANGSLLPLANLLWVDHSAAMQMLAVIPGQTFQSTTDTYVSSSTIQLYQDAFLNFMGTVSLPQFTAGSGTYPGYGQFVFWNAAQTQLIAVEKADASANLTSAFGVSILSPSTAGQRAFSFQSPGGYSAITTGTSNSLNVGSVRIVPSAQSTSPTGLAIFAYHQDGVLVSEATVPAVIPSTSGRIYAEVGPSVETGVAIANPNSTPATVSFYFTDQNGTNYGTGTTTIPANGQIALFLDQAPFSGGSTIEGTYTFSSNVPVGAIALRQFINGRGESLWTTLPVVSTGFSGFGQPLFPSFADGNNWVTQFVLINPTNNLIKGTLQFFPTATLNPVFSPVSVTINGQSGNTFAYSIPANSAVKLKTSGGGTTIQEGFAMAVPDSGFAAPAGVAIFSESIADGTVISEAGVPATTASNDVLLYAERSLDASQIQTGLALANTSTSAVTATLSVTTLDGAPLGSSTTLTIPANSQKQMFLNDIPGFQSLPAFQGVLRITSNFLVAVMGLRSRYNERNEFLMTTTSPVNTEVFSQNTYIFPHFADGGGFTTQFILLPQGQAESGTLQFLGQNGAQLNPTFQN